MNRKLGANARFAGPKKTSGLTTQHRRADGLKKGSGNA